MLDLEQRLPGDHVTGNISFTFTLRSVQVEGSEVTVPTQMSQTPGHVPLHASVSLDSCISIEDDRTPLVSLRGAPPQHHTHSQPDDIIPIVTSATNELSQDEGATPNSPLETSPTSLPEAPAVTPTSLGRQASDPIHPSMIRQVLYGSSQRVGPDSRGSSLQRHRSLFTRASVERRMRSSLEREGSGDSATRHSSSVLVKGIHSEPEGALPPSE